MDTSERCSTKDRVWIRRNAAVRRTGYGYVRTLQYEGPGMDTGNYCVPVLNT